MSFSTVAVVGLGPNGCTLAQAIAEADVPVLAVRASPGKIETARRRIEREIVLRVREGELSEDDGIGILSRIRFSQHLSDVRGMDLVIESSGGDPLSRRAVLATLESCLSQGAVLASNVGGARMAAMAEVVRRRDQLVGMRFFHPATRTSLVELSTLPETAPGVRLACEIFCRWLGKSPITVAEGAPAPDPREVQAQRDEARRGFSARARHLRGVLLASELDPQSAR